MIVFALATIFAVTSDSEPTDTIIDAFPDEMNGLQTDAPLIEHDEEDPDYILRVTQIFYDIDGTHLQFEWSNHNANPDHFQQEVDQLPSFDPPDYIPGELAELPIGINREDDSINFGFYFEDINAVFTVEATAEDGDIRDEFIGRGMEKLDLEKLLDWEGFSE